jgi:hypothetical protein
VAILCPWKKDLQTGFSKPKIKALRKKTRHQHKKKIYNHQRIKPSPLKRMHIQNFIRIFAHHGRAPVALPRMTRLFPLAIRTATEHIAYPTKTIDYHIWQQ